MSYEMRSLRKEDLSLHDYIKNTVLREFIELEEEIELKLMPELCSTSSYVYETITTCGDDVITPSHSERGRGWLYFDEPVGGLPCEPFPSVSGTNGDGDSANGTPEQSSRVIVYEVTSSGTTVVPWTDYMIDYIDGRIITERQLTDPTVTYYWNYVSVVDEWAAIQAADPPVVVIDTHGTDKMGYQLGGGRKTTRKVDIHIFASDPAERNDMVETIYDGLFNRSCPVYDFPTGTVLDYDGTFYGRRDLVSPTNKLTYLFDRSALQYVSKLQFDSVTSRHVNLPLVMTRGRDEIMLSDLNAYRSKISFDMFSYDDRAT